MEDKRIKSATSLDNGIIFYSDRIPQIGVKTFYDDNDEIQYTYVSKYDEMLKTYNEAIKSNLGRIYVTAHILIVFTGFLIYMYTENMAFWLLTLYIILTGTYENIIYMIISLRDFKANKGKKHSLARFHAAEHKSINAYNKKCKIPTYDEIANASRFSKYCGSMIYFNKTFMNIINCIFVYIFVANAWKIYIRIKSFLTQMEVTTGYYVVLISIIIIIALSAQIIYLTIKHIIVDYSLLQFMEVLYTEKPTKREIYLALNGLKNYEKMEKMIKEVCKVVTFDFKNGVILEISGKGEV